MTVPIPVRELFHFSGTGCFFFFCIYSIYQLYGKSLLDYIPYCGEKVLSILLKKFNEELLNQDLKTKVSKLFFFLTAFFSTNFSPRHLKPQNNFCDKMNLFTYSERIVAIFFYL